jgi:hypothetical protein
MDNFETEPTHVRERLLSFVLPLSLLFMKEQGLRATALFLATDTSLPQLTCIYYMYSLHVLTTCTHYMYSLHGTCTHYIYLQSHRSWRTTSSMYPGTCMTCTPTDRFVFHLNNFYMYFGKIRGIVLLKFLVIKMELNDQKKKSNLLNLVLVCLLPFLFARKKKPHKHHEWP